ncbi:MAG: hypothetical protein P8179_21975 [Candidatus Thiodiazotropha sp.]
MIEACSGQETRRNAQGMARPFQAFATRSQLLGHVEAEGSSQQRRPMPKVPHNIFT